MRRKQQGFNFRGFVALADMLFALSAGMLLLNPISFKPDSTPVPDTGQDAQAILVEMQKAEEALNKMEADGDRILSLAAEVIKNE